MKLSTSTEWLFFHLWKVSPLTNKQCPNILIPHTLIFRFIYLFNHINIKDGLNHIFGIIL